MITTPLAMMNLGANELLLVFIVLLIPALLIWGLVKLVLRSTRK